MRFCIMMLAAIASILFVCAPSMAQGGSPGPNLRVRVSQPAVQPYYCYLIIDQDPTVPLTGGWSYKINQLTITRYVTATLPVGGWGIPDRKTEYYVWGTGKGIWSGASFFCSKVLFDGYTDLWFAAQINVRATGIRFRWVPKTVNGVPQLTLEQENWETAQDAGMNAAAYASGVTYSAYPQGTPIIYSWWWQSSPMPWDIYQEF